MLETIADSSKEMGAGSTREGARQRASLVEQPPMLIGGNRG